MTSLKQVTILLYVAVFSPKNKLFGEVKVKIEYHRLCLCRTCNRDSCVGQWYICQPCCVSDSLSRDCNIFKSINCVCMTPVNKCHFCNSPWLTVVDRFDCISSFIHYFPSIIPSLSNFCHVFCYVSKSCFSVIFMDRWLHDYYLINYVIMIWRVKIIFCESLVWKSTRELLEV